MEKLCIKRLQHTIALTLSLAGGLYHMAWAAEALNPAALPQNPGTKENVDSIDTNDTTMTITQTKGKNRAFISWDTFNIGKDATVNIKQYSGADLLINAVRGNSMSEIAGKLNATGNVALINPNGVIFMNGAQVNVGGLGVYATGYDASDGIINSGKEGNIEIQSGATINVGVSAVLANLKALSIDPKDYAIAIDTTGEDGYTNRIHLVAEGNVDIQGGTTAAPTKITAKDYTYVGSNASVGEEGFNVGVGASGMGGKIYIRSDRDADDYGQVIITHGDDGSKPVMQSVNGVSIYTNAEQVDGDNDTTNGINAAVSRVESGDGATTTYYTKHNYKKIPIFDIDGSAYTDATSVSVDGPGTTADKLSNDTSDTNKNKISTSYAGNGATTVTTSLLVNNIDQLQDIEDENTGNLDGRYVLGRAIDAKNDAHAYIDDGVLYTKNSDGNVKKWSTADGVEITGTKSGGDLSKTVNGTTIGYSSTGNKATTKLTDGTTLSNSNGTVGAENTQWSTTKGGTTKGVSTVTDKTANSEYTIQSDNSVVNNGLTSNTTAKTITDGSSYTADISNNTITHTSDNSVTNTKSDTVTKPAGTSDAGYTATITDGTDTTAGTSGTIAIKDITYTVKDGTVDQTVEYSDSSVNKSTSTVTTRGVTTVVENDGAVTDAVKKGTVASDTVTVNGTTTTVTDGTTSYQITTGTDAVTYTKGTTTVSISGTTVTTGEVSADTSTSTVVKGDKTATITSDTAGTVTYSGRDYTVSDGTVSTTDSTTGKTITVTGEDAANVLTIFSDAKADLSNAQSIYSGYTTDAAKAQSLTNTLDTAIETLNKVKANSIDGTTVQETFQSAAKQLQSDTTLFNTASIALGNATTALNQYNALQRAISDNTALEAPLKQAYDEFQSTHLDETTINNIHSDKWDEGKGFNPIGDTTNPFTGTIDGFSGERVFGISNLTINRPDEDNVGLVGAAGASGNPADFVNLSLSNVSITGKNKVGAIAGTLQNGSHISWSSTSGTVTGTGESVGGFAGLVDNSSMWDISNSATVQGKSTDGTDKKIGGIAGTLKNSSILTDVRNFGTISGTEDVGGIAGYVENGTILGTGSAIYNYANTYNTGKVTGTTDTGGIVGYAKGIYMYGVFNMNEDAPLSKTSQLIIDDNNKVIQRGDGKTNEVGKSITDADLQSNYGKVKGVTNTGGLVGYLEDAPDFKKTVTNINVNSTTKTETDGTTTKEAFKDAPITNNVIDTSYNAGNITGTGDNTGGLVGKMTGGTLSNVYNADNNTVLRELGTIPDAVKNAKIEDTSDHSKTYAYSKTKVSEPNNKDTTNNQDLTQYYSFFTVGIDGTRTYYYFLPVSTTSGTTQKGAGGIYVDKNGSPVASLPSTSERYYFNRTFNKDANVTSTGTNTGGLVGSMTTTAGTTAAKYSAGSVIDSAYNAGTITGSTTDTTTTGALVGSKDDASLIKDSFYVTGTDAANGNTYSNTVSKTVGASSSQDKNIENTDVLDVTRSKKKFYVSNDSTRKNFPGVQQKTLTEKDETDSKSTIYYEYTSGTNGSFYTDGTGSMDSISHIYPITTTGTTDSTGKTTYTSTRSTKASYTRQADGTFIDTSENKDTAGTIYNATYDTATRQIVLTPKSGSTNSNTVVLNAVLAARTANETWTIYEDQTRPLLTAFLNKASLSRTFNYDGTTHNLKTDDVANLYGRADFDGSAGKDVQLSNYQLSSNGVSSEYTYDNTSIWSPQHGYYMDPESTLVITPVNMSANLYGTRVYGDIFNTRGYYVCVPYTGTVTTEDGKTTTKTKYSFYKPAEDGSENYTHLSDTDVINFLGKENATEADLLAKAEDNGFYVLELNGFINGEGVDNLGKLITGLVTTLSKSDSTSGATSDTTKGKDLQHLFSNVTADTYLDAGIYNVTNAQITGLTATNQNYTINYGGQLTVKQAKLYYTYDGKREYGAQNKDGEHTYTLVGVDSNTTDSNGNYTSTHGFLKYWDINGNTITLKDDDGITTATIENPYKDFFTATTVDGKTTYAINQKYIGVEGYTAEKTTTTTDVTTGKSTTTTDKDETKSVTLNDLYEHMKGTVNTDSINKPADSTTTPKTIGSYGDGAVDKDMYTHVLVDKDGNPIGYKVTSFASTNASADTNSTIQLYFKTDVADSKVKEDAVKRFNQNYKLVWKEGGTYDKKYTIGKPETVTTAKDTVDAGIKTETGGLKVNDSTFTILPKTATVTITGNRQYGDMMSTTPATSSDTPYSTTVGSITAGLSNEAKKYNIDIDGLTNIDTTDILSKDKTTALLEKIDQKDGSAADAGTQINKYTNVKRDAAGAAEAQDINGFEKSKISVVNGDASTDKMNVTSTTTTDGTTSTTTYDNSSSILKSNNYDYILQDGTHQLKITPVDIHVKVEGSKTYGGFNSQAATDYTASVSGGVSFNPTQTGKVTLKTGEVADILIANNLNEQSNAGTYTYDSSNPKTDADKSFTISLTDDTANTDANDYNADNYNISFDTTYTIGQAELWYTYEGSRDYGADNTTTKSTFKLVGVDGADSNERVRGFLKSWDASTYGVGSDKVISLTTVGDDKNALYTMSGMANAAANKQDTTIRSITGGNSADAYSHVIVDSTGKVIGYNLSALGLSSDANLSLTDTAKNTAFKNNYKLVWKPQVQAADGKGTILSSQTTTASVKDAATNVVSTNDARKVNVGASTLTINPVALTVEVTGKREYGHTMGDKYVVSTNPAHTTLNADGTGVVNTSGLTNETYNINLDGLKNGDGESVLNGDAVKNLLGGIDAGDSTAVDKISRYTSVKQSGSLATDIDYQGEKVYAYELTKKSGNSDYTGSQITVTGTTGTSEANHYDLLAKNNYDYTLQDGTHTLTIDRHDLNLNITAERKYGDISNQKVVSDYLSTAKKSGAEGAELSYKTGITSDENGLQNGETIDFTNSDVELSQDFCKADVGEYKHDWYNDDTSKGYTNGTAGITNITLKAGKGSGFNAKNYNIHYTTTYKVDKADLYYTYDGERNYGQNNSAATHTYTIVGQDGNSSKESVRGYLKSWDSGVLADGSVLNKDLLTVTNVGNGAYTMTGRAIQGADTKSADNAINVTAPETSQSIGKNSDYSHVIVDKDGKILSYTLDSFGTELAGSKGTLAKNYNLVWKQGGDSHQLDKVYTAADTSSTIDANSGVLQATTDTVNKITVNNSSFKINPLALTVTVTGQRDYGEKMDADGYVTDGNATDGHYKVEVSGSFANGETAGTVLDENNVKKMLESLENDETKGEGAATHENSNGKDGKISRYTDVKRNEADKSKIDSYSLNVDSTDTSSTITLASADVNRNDDGKVISFNHADMADSSQSHGFNVLNDNNYDYVIKDGTHTLTITPVDLTVNVKNVKGESTYGKTDTKYTVTSTSAKNGETMTVDSGTLSNLVANSPAGSYTANEWTDTTGAATSTASTKSGKYLNTAELRSGTSPTAGTDTDKGIYTVQLGAGENTDGSGLSTFSVNNYNITYRTTQVINPAKLTITINGTKVYGSQPTGLTTGNMRIMSGELATGDSLAGLTIANNMGRLTDVGTYRHNWSQSAGLNGNTISAESYTYDTVAGTNQDGNKDAASWITGVTADNKTFDFNNYDVDFQSTYEVTKRPLQLDVTSTSVYGDPKSGYTYTATALKPVDGVEEGLVNGQQFNATDIKVSDDIKAASDAGTYTHTAAGTSYTDASNNPQNSTYKGITAVEADSLKDAGNTGFKSSNYDITLHQGTHTVEKRTVRATVSGSQVYGESAPTSGEAYTIAFEMAGGTGVAVSEGLAHNQTIANGQVTVQNSVGQTNDVGTYTTTQSDVGEEIAYGADNPERVDGKDQGIYGLLVADGNGFQNKNYNIVLDQGSYTVTKRPVTFLTTGSRTYGEENTAVKDYTIQQLNTAAKEGLTGRNAGMVTAGSTAVANSTLASTDVGKYGTESDVAQQVLNIDPAVQEILGDDYKNYNITYKDEFTINPRTVRVTVAGESTYGDNPLTDGKDYKTIAFEQAGADGVAAQEGLALGQTIDKSQVTVQNSITPTTDAGTYGIDGIKVQDGNGFKNKNYNIVLEKGSYTVTKRTVRATASGSQVYGESAPTDGEAYDIAFATAGGNGVNAHEGLVNGQTIDKSQVTVQNSVGQTNDVGTYTTSQSDVGEEIAYGANNPERVDGKDQGIYGLLVADGNGFQNKNYNIVLDQGSYTVTKRPVTFLTTGSRTYGEENTAVKDYTIQQLNTAAKEGLTGRNAGMVTAGSTAVANSTLASTDVGKYGTESDVAQQVLNIDPAVQEILGDDYKNYNITYKDEFTINPRTVRVTVAGESTYGDNPLTDGKDYKTIAFEQAGADGVAAQEGLALGQTIDKSQVTVQNSITPTTDAGTYGIDGIKVQDGNGFKNKNYTIIIEGGTYTVNKRPLTLTIKGEKTYGDPTSFSGKDYTVSQSGLQNNETIDFGAATVVHSAETGDRFSNAGEYHSSDNKGILGFDDSTLHGNGFKLGNYELTYDTVFVIDKRPVDVYMESRRTSGSPSSLRMDEPMTMRNVPQEHQGRFLADMQILDSSPQVIAAGDYPGEDGAGYLDLSFAGDIYRNYMIHRHTVYHILPDRMMKPSVYNAVQPVRRPILDVMYLKVNGSEGINRWSGVETPKDDGAIILKDGLADRMNQPNQSDQPKHLEQPNQPVRPVPQDGMGGFREEVNQAVPVVYTDGENKELGGRYHLAYENDAVVVRPTADTAEVPTLREASVAQESHKTLRVPYQGAEGEYEVAYADGIVQLYPKNDAARQLAQAKGGDEQLLLRSGLDSAVQQLGIQLEDVEAVYIFTK